MILPVPPRLWMRLLSYAWNLWRQPARLLIPFLCTDAPLPQIAAEISYEKLACVCAAGRLCCDPAHDQTNPIPDTTAVPHLFGSAAQFAALMGYHTENLPTDILRSSLDQWAGGRISGCISTRFPHKRTLNPTHSPISAEGDPLALNLLSLPCVTLVASLSPPRFSLFYHISAYWATLSTGPKCRSRCSLKERR